MIFGYVIYTFFIFLVIFGIVTIGLVGFTGNTWTKTGKVVCVIVMMLLGWLLYYIVSSPHRDIYVSNVKGNVTEYTYYNYFQTDSVIETRKTDEWVTGNIIEIRPSRYSVNFTIQLSDGNTINYSTSDKIEFDNTIRLKKCYWITTHYELNGTSIWH